MSGPLSSVVKENTHTDDWEVMGVSANLFDTPQFEMGNRNTLRSGVSLMGVWLHLSAKHVGSNPKNFLFSFGLFRLDYRCDETKLKLQKELELGRATSRSKFGLFTTSAACMCENEAVVMWPSQLEQLASHTPTQTHRFIFTSGTDTMGQVTMQVQVSR